MKIYTVFINGREGAELYDFEKAVCEAYEQIARKNRDADTEHCIAELEQARSCRFADTYVEIRESEYVAE